MLHTKSLPPATHGLLDLLSTIPEVAQFTLIGGTALALAWAHRQSEDIDLAYPGHNLPLAACRKIISSIMAAGWTAADVTDQEAAEQARNEGDELYNSHQDYSCENPNYNAPVKLTFFAEYEPKRQVQYSAQKTLYGSVHIMKPEQLFALKSGLLLRRSTARDLFDLGEFLRRGKTVDDIVDAVAAENPTTNYNFVTARLLPGKTRLVDPPVSLVDGTILTLDEVKARITPFCDKADEAKAAQVILRKSKGPKFSP